MVTGVYHPLVVVGRGLVQLPVQDRCARQLIPDDDETREGFLHSGLVHPLEIGRGDAPVKVDVAVRVEIQHGATP